MPSTKITLNKDQKAAVQHKSGPLLVVAGAGTGKTRVITERIKYLIKTKKISPNDVLAVTFTEKASQEMLGRLDEVMPLGYEEPWIYTFHAFADRILRNEGLEIGLDSSYKIIPYPQQWLLLRQNLFDLDLKYFRPLGNPTKFISTILKFISRLQDENISPEELEKYAKSLKESENSSGEDLKEEKERFLELAYIYKKYTDFKLQNSKMDFGDLINWSIKLFSERPNILKKYQKQFKHVLVDEFQDTNYAQYELIKLLCPTKEFGGAKKVKGGVGTRSLLVVGDDSQSIYKFRGAAVSNILEFQKDYPSAKMITLLTNYRSTQKILDPAYKLVKNNNPDTLESKLGISKKLNSIRKSAKSPTRSIVPHAVQLKTAEDEVEFVVLKMLELLGREPELSYKDFAILARANNHLDAFVFALRKYGLPYQLVGNRGLYDREEIRDMLALLRVITNPSDSVSLYRALNIDVFEVNSDVVSKILATVRYEKKSMWEVVSNSTDGFVEEFAKIIREFQDKITERSPTDMLHELVNTTGYLHRFVLNETVENQLSIQNLNLLLDRIKRFEIDYRDDTKEIPTIIDFLDYIDLMIDAGESPAQAQIEDIDTINLMTVHASKGLEFPVVFMVNLVGGRFPTRDRKDLIRVPDELIKETLPVGNAHLQEERRLFYVGMTRAEKYLYLVSAKNYGGKRDASISGYIEETGLKVEEFDVVGDKKQESLFGVGSEFRSPKAQKVQKHIPTSLSYSKISDYNVCPLKYRYRYVLNVPTAPSHALSFGITIHDTLRDFHAAQIVKDKVTLKELLSFYEKNWHPLGYLDAKHRDVRFESGKKLLRDYYKNNKDLKAKPLALEKSFVIKIGGIKFYGRIDRIDPLKDGGVEIIDYKTGNTKDQKQVDKDDQVAFYAIAAKEALKMDPKKMTMYFLEGGKKVSTTRTEKDLEKKKKEVGDVIKKMKSGDFKATPGMHCTWCDFKEVCPFAFKG